MYERECDNRTSEERESEKVTKEQRESVSVKSKRVNTCINSESE